MPGWRSGIAVAIAATALVATGSAQAKTFEVTRANDPNPGKCKPRDCSLREAIQAANARSGKDKVVLPDRRYRLGREGFDEDGGNVGDLDVLDPLALSHPGKGKATINAGGIDRVLNVQANARTTATKIVFTNGDAADQDGGGILADSNLTLRRSVVTRNEATGTDSDGGAIDLDDDALLTMKGSLLTGNSAGGAGGAVNSSGGGMVITGSKIIGNESVEEGGGLDTLEGETVRITRSRIERNRTETFAGGIEVAAGSLVLKQSTVAGNASGQDAGGIGMLPDGQIPGTITLNQSTVSGNRAPGPAGGIYITEGTLNAVNSTIAGNSAGDNGGGIRAGDGATVSLNAVTITRNIAFAGEPVPALQGGGIYQIDSTVEVRNTIIALNGVGIEGSVANDCEGETFTSLGNNLLSTTNGGECEGFTAIGDMEDSTPGVGELKQNGGPTKTAALNAGSSAIGNADNGSAPARDQRNRKRDNQPDIGAFERGA